MIVLLTTITIIINDNNIIDNNNKSDVSNKTTMITVKRNIGVGTPVGLAVREQHSTAVAVVVSNSMSHPRGPGGVRRGGGGKGGGVGMWGRELLWPTIDLPRGFPPRRSTDAIAATHVITAIR